MNRPEVAGSPAWCQQGHSRTEKRWGRRSRVLVAALVSWCVLVVMPGSASAAAEPFTVEFDESLADVGGGAYGAPGFDGVNDVVPTTPEVRVKLSAVIENGEISADPGDLVVEPGSITIVPFHSFYKDDWRAIGPISGTFDEETGAMTLVLRLEQTVTYGSASCVVGPVPVTLSTEQQATVGSGTRFAEGPTGAGALVGSWAETPEPSGAGCGLRELGCEARQGLAKGPGAFGVARGGINLSPPSPRTGDPTDDKFGIFGYEDEGGCLGKRPDPEPGHPDLRIQITRLSAGKSAIRFLVKVTNRGATTSDAKLCARATHRARLNKRGCRTLGRLEKGAQVQRRLKVFMPKGKRARKRALRKGKIAVRSTTAGVTSRETTRRLWAGYPEGR